VNIWRAATGWVGVWRVASLALVVAGVCTGCVSDRYPEGVPLGTPAGIAALGEQIDLGDAVDAYYRWDGAESITAVLVPSGAAADGADYTSLTVVRVMWRPRSGATPLEQTATNTAVRHLVFAGPSGDASGPGDLDAEPPGELLGVFTGAGFVGLRGDPAGGVLDLAVREADLRLTDCSAGYAHPLRRAALTARVWANRDDAAVSRWLKAAGVRASEALGYPTWVRAPRPAADPNVSSDLHLSSGSGVDRCIMTLPAAPLPGA